MRNKHLRRLVDDEKVLATLNDGAPWHPYQLWKATDLRLNRLYAALIRLENRGAIVSGWNSGPRPRRRWYQLNRSS